jgi:hypothetical protein
VLGLLFKLPAIITAVVVTALVVGYFTLGRQVSPKSLSHSVTRTAKGLEAPPCRQVQQRAWRCTVGDVSGGGTRYAVRTDGHCWDAHRTRLGGEASPARIHGCVGLRDQLRIW